ncbi:MAG: alpha/beta fold hydrolase [Parcubacteria group bacterium]
MSASNAPPLRGRMVDIGGRRLHIVCKGAEHAGPTVLCEAGAFGFSADWAEVQDQLATHHIRSCAYDRAGLGRSDPGPRPRDGLAIVSDLEALLRAAREPGPFILVGHSMAGLHVRLFAARNPDKVKGVVLVDAVTAEATRHPTFRSWVGGFQRASTLAAHGARFGLFKPFSPIFGDKIGLKSEAAAEKRHVFASVHHNQWAAEEVSHWIDAARQAEAAGAYDPTWPVAVVTAGPMRGRELWKAEQASPAITSRHPYVVNVSRAGHANLLGERYAQAIVKAILFVRGAAGH